MILTNWGYSLVDANALPRMLSVDEFDVLTGNKFSGDIRIANTIAAVEASIRNFVGWHLAGNEKCSVEFNALDGHIIRTGRDIIVQLPTKYLTAVEEVKINDTVFEDYMYKTSGTVRLFDAGYLSRRSTISVVYHSGINEGLIEGVKELITNRVTRAITQPMGVQSEASGGISITYSASWVSNGAGALVDDNREVLIPYKLAEVF